MGIEELVYDKLGFQNAVLFLEHLNMSSTSRKEAEEVMERGKAGRREDLGLYGGDAVRRKLKAE